jgi:hypothetical protein
MGSKRDAYRLTVKPEGKRPLGRQRCRWVVSNMMYLGEIGCGDMDWFWLAHDEDKWAALVKGVLNFLVP